VLVVGTQAGVVQRLLGPARLARERVGAVDLLLADGLADEDRGHDEGKPAQDRDLPVLGAPVGGAGGDVASLGHGADPLCSRAPPSSG
jgi:hypothetical protein